MIVPEFNVDRVSWNTALRKFWAYSNKSVEEITRAQARLLAVELARQTQPFGDDTSAQQRGQRRVEGDISKVFISQDKLNAWGLANYRRAGGRLFDWFTRALEKGNLVDAKTALDRMLGKTLPVVAEVDPQFHQSQRNSRGRIGRKPKREVVAKSESVARYIESKKKLVGYGKSGWAQAARDLGGTRGIPGWVSKNRGPGYGQDNTRGPDKNVVLANDVPYASDIITDAQLNAAFRIQGEKMEKAVDHALAYEASRTIAA